MFRAIASDNFPPFGKFRLDFPSVENKPADLAEVHLLTGVNGTGKTRLLAVLASMLGGHNALSRRAKGFLNPVAILGADEVAVKHRLISWPRITLTAERIQGFAHTNPDGLSVVQWAGKVPAFAYNGIAFLTDTKISVLAGVPKPNRVACLEFSRPEKHSGELLQAIANLKVQAAMDSMNSGEGKALTRSTRIIQALEKALTEITGRAFLFNVSSYPEPKIFVRWGTTDLQFDLLPDGLRSIIGWMVGAVVMLDAWLQGEGSPLDTEAVFLLDEVESHLHPAWQRRILPAFQRLFPKAQIFIATHSPFVIASLNHGWIHRLTMGGDGLVKIEKPQAASAGDSYISVVEDIMGLREWYDPETEQLLSKFREHRDAARGGNAAALATVTELAGAIGQRSMELNYMMGQEMSQLNRQLAKTKVT